MLHVMIPLVAGTPGVGYRWSTAREPIGTMRIVQGRASGQREDQVEVEEHDRLSEEVRLPLLVEEPVVLPAMHWSMAPG